MVARIGGSFAPPINSETLAGYKALIPSAPPEVGEVMGKLCEMVEVFQQTPASTLAGSPHPVGRGQIVPLEDAEIKRIWDYVPWEYEIKAYQGLFDELASDSPLRTPCFHLLWYAVELCKDREPITNDKI